jgi:NodT family efflux transporter outer membrane factor (OMF) lipoprotein
MLLDACRVGPAYRQPVIAAPTAWTEDSGGTDAWPDAQWWHGFAAPQLDELIAEAQQHNDDLAAAVARVREADAEARIAGAALLPGLDLAATATRERAPVSGVGPETYNNFAPGVAASYEIDFWGRNRAQRDAAVASARASRFSRETVALTVVSGVATTYFQALELRDRIAVAQDNLVSEQKILHGLQLEESVGTATGLDVAQQETAVSTLYASIPPLEEQLRQTVYALAVLVGASPESLQVGDASLHDVAAPPVVAGLPSGLLARRPDVRAAEQQLIAANADITVARAALFPSITLTASGGYASSALAHLISPASRIYAGTAGLTQPIFHAGALRAQVAYSQAYYDELLAGYHKAVLNAFGNAESALVAVRQTDEQRRRQATAVAAARRAYEFARAQMAAGTVNVLTVLNTELAFFTAQDTLVQVEYAHLQALVGLYTALGGGWS